MASDLERTVEERVLPLLDDAMQRYLGVRVEEIKADVSDRLLKSPVFDFPVDVSVPFKRACRAFRRAYVERLLRLHFGNVSEVARLSGLDRRSIHRVIGAGRIRVDPFRAELHRSEYIKRVAVQSIIESSVQPYRSSLSPARFDSFYSHAPELSRDIVRELPVQPLSLREAERRFERAYLEKLLALPGSLQELARRAGIRYETLHRKLRVLGVKREANSS